MIFVICDFFFVYKMKISKKWQIHLNVLFYCLCCSSLTHLSTQESADDLVKLYKRVSLDDDLDDQLRAELLSQLAHGASQTLTTLKLVKTLIHNM